MDDISFKIKFDNIGDFVIASALSCSWMPNENTITKLKIH